MNELADLLRDLHGRGIIRDAEIAYLPIPQTAVASVRADGTPLDLRGDPVRQSRAVEIRKPNGVRTWITAYTAEDLVAKVREWAQTQETP